MPDVDAIRAALEHLMRATLADEAAHHNWTYFEVRPSPVPAAYVPAAPVKADCSKGVQYLCRWAGAPDPMQNDFAPLGNSQTIWLKLHHATHAVDLQIGDPVTFGTDGDQHAAIVLEPGPDPLLWSNGHRGAPNTYRLSQDGRPAQFCMLPIVEPPPSPKDKLREHTDFYSWVAWRLGEGPWKPYGKSNVTVRPNVPKRISTDWWGRYNAFLAHRHHGNPATGNPATGKATR